MSTFYEYEAVVGFPIEAYLNKVLEQLPPGQRKRARLAERLNISGAHLAQYEASGRMPKSVYERMVQLFGNHGLPQPKVHRARQPYRLHESYRPGAEIPVEPESPTLGPEVPAPQPPPALPLEMTLAREIASQSIRLLTELLVRATGERDALAVQLGRVELEKKNLESQVEMANQLLGEQGRLTQHAAPALETVPPVQQRNAVDMVRDVVGADAAVVVEGELEQRLPKGTRTG